MPSSSSSSARVANLLRLMHAVSHDLSNPLQALVLHATIGVEDAEPGSEAALRHHADVEATRRMRTLLRALQGLATAGDRPRTLASVQARFVDIFGERYARLGVPLEVGPLPEGVHEVSALVEEALVAVGLALGTRVRRSAKDLDAACLVVRASGSEPLLMVIDLRGAAAASAIAEVARELTEIDPAVEIRAEGTSLVLRVDPGGGGA